jgi:site-specific DNA-cytosine methylase
MREDDDMTDWSGVRTLQERMANSTGWDHKLLKDMPPVRKETLWILEPMCGAGGLVLGLKMAIPNAQCICIDISLSCVETVHHNLKNNGCYAIQADCRHLPIRLDMHFDIIAAGTPCQGFSMSNNKRFTSARARFMRDLSYVFAKIVFAFQPQVFMMENVEGMRAFPDYVEGLRTIFELTHFVTIALLDACDYGVPQHRRRMIWLGSVFEPPVPPTPTHTGACPKCRVKAEHWWYTVDPGFVEVMYVCPKCRKIWLRANQMEAS